MQRVVEHLGLVRKRLERAVIAFKRYFKEVCMSFDQGSEVRMDVSVESHLDGTNLHLTTKVAGEVSRRILILEEEAIKKALISLGWTPPRREM